MSHPRSLLLVTGAGRSGTSTIAGTLVRLGFHVPQPVIEASEANPRGFYESWWPVHFHNRLLKRAALAKSDGQPAAAELVAKVVRDSDVERLRRWLEEQLGQSDLVVVKDPRAAVVPELWSQAATAVDARIGFVTMLRHPTEVIASRATHYMSTSSGLSTTQATRVATGWLNHNLTLERRTRDQHRAFVSYVDLLDNWRAALGDIVDSLDTPLDSLADPTAAAEVDAFIEPSLRRHQTSWDGLGVPPSIRETAEAAWSALASLTGPVAHDDAAEQRLDEIASRYADLYSDAEAIVSHHTSTVAEKARRVGLREGRKDAEARVVQASPTGPRPLVRAKGLVARLAGRSST